MPDSEQLRILKSGVRIWNEWWSAYRRKELRRLDGELQIELQQRGTSDIDRIPEIVRPDLREADLRDTDLRNADLVFADLGGADLRGADLREARLSGARLTQANLSGANLGQTDFSNSDFGATILCDVDLSNVRGLLATTHRAPSFLGHETLRKSKGGIPTDFLRGVGLQDWEIETAKLYRPSISEVELTDIQYHVFELRSKGVIQYYSCFISFSFKDQEFAKKLHDDLQEKGVRCWLATEDLRAGEKIVSQLSDAIRFHDKLLLILSRDSIRSKWVATEIKKGQKHSKDQGKQMLFPIRVMNIDDLRKWELFDADSGVDLAEEIRAYFIPDFTSWHDPGSYRISFERLLSDLRTVELR